MCANRIVQVLMFFSVVLRQPCQRHVGVLPSKRNCHNLNRWPISDHLAKGATSCQAIPANLEVFVLRLPAATWPSSTMSALAQPAQAVLVDSLDLVIVRDADAQAHARV